MLWVLIRIAEYLQHMFLWRNKKKYPSFKMMNSDGKILLMDINVQMNDLSGFLLHFEIEGILMFANIFFFLLLYPQCAVDTRQYLKV